MMNIRKYLSVVVLVLFLAVGFVIGQLAPAPVQAFGPAVSGTVDVANFPATQPVSGTVSVGNFPAAQKVSFGNTSATPLFTRGADNPATQPVMGFCDILHQVPDQGVVACNIALYTPSGALLSSVPTGQELVIEAVSGELEEPTGAQPQSFAIQGMGFGAAGFFGFVLRQVRTVTSPGLDIYELSQQTRLYASAGSTLVLAIQPSTGSSVSAQVSISGYFVNLP